MDTIIIFALIGGLVYWLYTVSKKRRTVIVDENSFYQNGVRVDFAASTISIGKHTYPVNKVTGIRANTQQSKHLIGANGGNVEIEVDDFVKPVHKVIFNGYSVDKDTKEFAQRLSIAIRKAGGTSFT